MDRNTVKCDVGANVILRASEWLPNITVPKEDTVLYCSQFGYEGIQCTHLANICLWLDSINYRSIMGSR